MGLSSICFTALAFCVASIVMQSFGELLVLRYSPTARGSTEKLTCISDDDDSAFIWNNVPQDFQPVNPKRNIVSECAISDSSQCRARWDDMSDWKVVESAIRPMAPVFDFRWEGFKEYTSDKMIDASKYQYLGKVNQSSGNAVFSVRGKQDVHVLLCEKRDQTEGPCFWVIIGGWSDAISMMRYCPDGAPTDEEPPMQGPCLQIDVVNAKGILDSHEWRTLRLTWTSDEKTIALMGDSGHEENTILNGYVKRWPNVSHMSVRLDKTSIVRFHFYEYLLTEKSGSVLYTKEFNFSEEEFCVEMLVGLCPICGLWVEVMDENNRNFLISKIIGAEKFVYNGTLIWQSIKLTKNIEIDGQELSKSFRLEIRTFLTRGEGEGQWAVDNFRMCKPADQRRKSTISSSQIKPDVRCQKLSYNGSTIVNPWSSNKIISSTAESRKFINKLIDSCGSSCESFGKNSLLCNSMRCTCNRGYKGSNCDTACTDGYHGYNCDEICTPCIIGSCNKITGLCARGCPRNTLLPPHCEKEIERPNVTNITDTTATVYQNIEFQADAKTSVDVVIQVKSSEFCLNFTASLDDPRRPSFYKSHLLNLSMDTIYTVHTIVSVKLADNTISVTSPETNFTSTCLMLLHFIITTGENELRVSSKKNKVCVNARDPDYSVRILPLANNETELVHPHVVLPALYANLTPYTDYRVIISDTTTNRVLFDKEVRTLKLGERNSDDDQSQEPNLGWLAGPLILAICLVLLFIGWRNRKVVQRRPREASYVEPVSSSSTTIPRQPRPVIYTEVIPLSLAMVTNDSTDFHLRVSSISQLKAVENELSDNLYSLPNEPNSCSVSMECFEEYVKDAAASGLLYSQFMLLRRDLTRPYEYGSLPENMPKNRCRYQIAYDHSRVVLRRIPGDSYSDYINASYIKGYRKNKAYIAAEGPKPNTVNDFWRMVWQEEVRVICMLTNVTKNAETEWEKYWPDVGTRVVRGDFHISNIDEQVSANYTLRIFELSHEQNTRKVTHLYYTEWPNLGVPTYPQSLVEYLKKLGQMRVGNGPVLVHCSTGDDRTGTVILCDICLQQVINVTAVITRMRDSRANMVGTLQQYVLAHIIITETIVSWSTQISSTEVLSTGMKRLRMQLPHDIQRLNDSKWQEQALESSLKRNLPTAQEEANAKILDPMPDRPEVIYDDVFDIDRDQINAVSVDSFKVNKQYLACSLPSPLTLACFWGFIIERDIKLIIMVQCSDPRYPTCVDIMPDKSIIVPMLDIQVENKTSLDEEEYFTNEKLLLKDTSQGQARSQSVAMLTCKGWGCGRNQKPPPPATLIALWRASEKIPRKKGDTLVLCHDGITGCGLYLALSFLLEQMTMERECNVISAVRSVRRSEPKFVQSLEQFDYLYDAAVNYSECFLTYANLP